MEDLTVTLVSSENLLSGNVSDGMTLTVLCNGYRVTATIATSWAVSAISPEIRQSLGLPIRPYNRGIFVEPVTRRLLFPKGLTKAFISLNKKFTMGDLLVLYMGPDLLLGCDFLKAFRVEIKIGGRNIFTELVESDDGDSEENSLSLADSGLVPRSIPLSVSPSSVICTTPTPACSPNQATDSSDTEPLLVTEQAPSIDEPSTTEDNTDSGDVWVPSSGDEDSEN